MRAIGYWLLAIGLVEPTLSAQQAPLPSHPSPLTVPEPGSELTVKLITYYSGERIYERFGHNALVIHNARTGTDDHYDYGRFSFEQEHFLLRFVQGRMWYSMGYSNNVPGMLDFYRSQGRTIWEQELDLTPAQRQQLQTFLVWNYRPENSGYAYDYYRDNCSTRIRDAIDRVLGGAIRRYGAQPSSMTWRDETRRLDQHSLPVYTGMLIALGHPVDAVMTRWEQMFLPMRLRDHLDSVQVAGPDGVLRPVVKSERLLAEGGRWPVPARPTSWLPGYLLAGLLLGAVFLMLGPTRAFLPVATLWTLLVGLLGAFLVWLWVFSLHWAAWRNENLLLVNPVVLALAFVLPSALRRKSWAILPARRLTLWIVVLAVLALLLKPLPWFRQHNLEVIALFLPAHLGLWKGLERALTPTRLPASLD